MKVTLLHATPIDIADKAIGKCWMKETDEPEKRMYRVANKYKHASTVEHVNYTFDIDGISRACLQELARHRHQSLSVKSSRYTLGELKNENLIYEDNEVNWSIVQKYIVAVDNDAVNMENVQTLIALQKIIKSGTSNDIAKYCMPEAYRTSLVSTFNMRSMQNFLKLRTNKAALREIRMLAHAMYDAIPEDHKFMLKDFVEEEKDES